MDEKERQEKMWLQMESLDKAVLQWQKEEFDRWAKTRRELEYVEMGV